MTDVTSTSTGAGAANPGLDAQLDQLVTTLRGGLGSLDPAAAVGIVDRFRTALAGSPDPAVASIATELEAVRSVLTGDHPGSQIAETLTTLAGKVTALADQGGPAADRLRELGQQLSQGAGQIARAD